MKLSIIVPTHNSEKYIYECVDSILHQTYEDIEVLCVDSSKDGTLSILQEFAQRDCRLRIIQDANGSYGHKINIGIQQATGEYIGIVESDDYILPSMYADMVSVINEEKPDFIKSNVLHFADLKGRRIFAESKHNIKEHNCLLSLDEVREEVLMGSPMIWSAIYRRDFLLEKQVWLNETPGASYQDTSFAILVALLAKNCFYLDKAYYCYRRDNENSSVLSKEKSDYVRQEMEYVERYLRANNLHTEEYDRLIRKKKLGVYHWNCMRLPSELAEGFIKSISHEMGEYRDKLYDTLSDVEKKTYKLLCGECSMRDYRREFELQKANVWAILSAAENGDKLVLVGAGKLGKKILCLQEYVNISFVEAIADNGSNVIGRKMGTYDVCKVADAVQQYPEHIYIIANKNYTKDIEKQLLSLGINQEKIMCIQTLAGESELLVQCVEYYKQREKLCQKN